MLGTASAASTHPVAAEAAMGVFHVEPGESPGTAIDAMFAGVMALAARAPGVLLGAGAILLGGTGEGLLAIDGRARQPGRGAQRPRGSLDERSIPEAARIAAPLLPAALSLAHAGRGVKTRTELVRTAITAAQAVGKVDDARVESLRAFGREGALVLHGGAVHEALIATTARSLGGVLTRDDLEALRPEIVQATRVDLDARRWALVPWATQLHAALDAAADATLLDASGGPTIARAEVAIVAACDARGAVALAAVLVPAIATHLAETGLSIPHLARPILRSVPREAPGAPLPMPSPIGIAHGRTITGGKSELGPVDLAAGVGGGGDTEALFAQIARGLSRAGASIDEVVAAPRARRGTDASGRSTVTLEEGLDPSFGIAAGVSLDPRGRGRPVVDPRRR